MTLPTRLDTLLDDTEEEAEAERGSGAPLIVSGVALAPAAAADPISAAVAVGPISKDLLDPFRVGLALVEGLKAGACIDGAAEEEDEGAGTLKCCRLNEEVVSSAASLVASSVGGGGIAAVVPADRCWDGRQVVDEVSFVRLSAEALLDVAFVMFGAAIDGNAVDASLSV